MIQVMHTQSTRTTATAISCQISVDLKKNGCLLENEFEICLSDFNKTLSDSEFIDVVMIFTDLPKENCVDRLESSNDTSSTEIWSEVLAYENIQDEIQQWTKLNCMFKMLKALRHEMVDSSLSVYSYAQKLTQNVIDGEDFLNAMKKSLDISVDLELLVKVIASRAAIEGLDTNLELTEQELRTLVGTSSKPTKSLQI